MSARVPAQPAAVVGQRAGGVRSGTGERQLPNQAQTVPRGNASGQYARSGVAPQGNTVIPRNSWTDQAGTGQQSQRIYDGNRTGYNPNGYRRHSRPYAPYLYQYYGGYYPVYIDVPVYYPAPAADVSGDADGGASATVNPDGSAAAVSPNVDGTGNAPASPQPTATPGTEAARSAIGPDSLVEAVQAELARRGYFQGKVDAVFRPDTEAAVRRFQQDNYLAPTGHLNEPTLHALDLD